MKITFLSDNKTEKAKCLAEWGLSILVESAGHKLLFDVGASSMFAQNAKALGIDLKDVEAVAISHGHYDHTEGMPAFCEINHEAPIYIHEDAIEEDFAMEDDGVNMDPVNYGIRWSKDFAELIGGRLVLTQGVTKVFDNMTLVGNIPLLPEYPMPEKFYRRNPENPETFVEDPMNHEQFLVVKEDEGIFVISGCSHKGVMSIINHVQKLFPGEKILGFIAGMHLYSLEQDALEAVVNGILSLGIEYIFPVHCTGIEGILMFRQKMGDRCIIATAGESYDC